MSVFTSASLQISLICQQEEYKQNLQEQHCAGLFWVATKVLKILKHFAGTRIETASFLFYIKLIFLPTWERISCLSKWQQLGQLSVPWQSTKGETAFTQKAAAAAAAARVLPCTGLWSGGLGVPPGTASPAAAERTEGGAAAAPNNIICQDNVFCLFAKECILIKDLRTYLSQYFCHWLYDVCIF